MLLIALVLALSVHPAYAQTWTVLHNFTGGSDGSVPSAGLTMDQAGNFYMARLQPAEITTAVSPSGRAADLEWFE